MKSLAKRLGGTFLGVSLLALPLGARALGDDGDSNADAGFHNVVAASAGVMIRVPVSNGTENGAAAELRLIKTQPPRGPATDLATTWKSGVDISGQPVVDPKTESTDSSTYGWYGWGRWQGRYGNYFNYYNYRPYYYYYNSYYPGYYNYYNYGYPYYSNNYGYNYYYYPYMGYGRYPY
jgi:hypothetical protein